MITDDMVQTYRADGFVVVPDVLDAPTLAEMRGVIAEIVAGAADVDAHNEVYDLEPGHTRAEPKVRRIKTPHKVHKLFDQLVRLPQVVSILQALIGPDVRLYGSKLNMKSARYGSPVEWHQDWAFYPHTNDDILAIGVMLDDTTVENGPLLCVPGTHKGPVWSHHGSDGRFCGAIAPAEIEAEIARAVPIVGRAGSMSFHHVRTLHGSAQNVSDRPRNLLLYEVAAKDAWPLKGVSDLAEFDSRLITGSGPTIEPRLAPVPARMPLPPPSREGSIYETQLGAIENSYFRKKTAA
ncbi:phytanoyl-CoA dioxygenase family protein [Acidocella sp.]|jgi:phytanoyl-CoA hydroxylase|uniref:phytanoyl-CoA dioxygenase family protein n=1 Tax=Acidocella sp. TaxID=50710 RepID=UPI002F412C2B